MSNDLLVDIDQLVRQLCSGDMSVRMRARQSLVAIGAAAVPAICRLANSNNGRVRWECAKTLSEIADPAAIDTLIDLLEDSDEGTRWDASIGLINIGSEAVAPLLKAIIHRSIDYTIICGARHVIHEFSKTPWGSMLGPLYDALNGYSPRESAPVEAGKALERWDYHELR